MHLLLDKAKKEFLDDDMMKLLTIITSNNATIPIEFYTLFENRRLEIINSEVVNISVNQKRMVILIYIIVKILVKYILIDSKYAKGKVDHDSIQYK